MAMPVLVPDLIEEILLRLPPDDPGCLFRASVVCKPWRSLVTDPRFDRRYRDSHGTPPLLGFFEIRDAFGCWFAPSSPTSPFPPIHPDPRDLFVLDSRHGLVLLRTPGWIEEKPPVSLIVWDPVSRRQLEFPPPDFAANMLCDNAVVLCAADRGGPFTVVYVGTGGLHASVFSSETRAWSAVATIPDPDPDPDPDVHVEIIRCGPKALVGNVLYFACCEHVILRFDLFSRQLSTIQGPMCRPLWDFHVLVKTEQGVLGCAMMEESEICLWSMETAPNDTVAWTPNRVVKLEKQLRSSYLLGFVDGPDLFYLKTDTCIFTVELKSGRVKKISISRFCVVSDCTLIPYMSFYTPEQTRRRMLPSTMASTSDRQVGDEQGGGWDEVSAEKECDEGEEHQEEIALQELFDKRSKAFKDGDFVSVVDCARRALNIRVAHHGKLSPKCFSTYVEYGRALLGKTILEIGSASNQESVEGITMQNDTRHSQDLDLARRNFHVTRSYSSDLDLPWRMLHLARSILEKNPGSTMENVEIFTTLAEVSMQGEDIGSSVIACVKALATLEHLVEPDHRLIFDLNLQIRFAFELESKIGDAKAISLCKSHIESLKRTNGNFLADKGDDASATEGGSSSLAKCIEYLTEKLLRPLEKKIQLEDLDEAIFTPVSEAIGEQNVGNDVPRDESLASSQCSGPSNLMPTGSTRTDLEAADRGIKRANAKQSSSEPSPKKFAESSPYLKVDTSNSSDGHLSASDSDGSVSD